MKKFTKIGAIVLAVVMLLALSIPAFADGEATLSSGEAGAFETQNTPVLHNKVIKIAKEITAYNPDVASVNAPTISYTYTVAAGTVDKSVTDKWNVQANTNVGTTTALKVNGAAGTTGTIAWATTETLNTSADGTANTKYFTLDFTDVVFTAPGVYRYKITEKDSGGARKNASITRDEAKYSAER